MRMAFAVLALLPMSQGRKYTPADARSTPSVPVRFTLRADPQGNWRLVDKIRLADQ